MCVIFLCGKTRPSEEMVRRAFSHNPDGGGIAWREQRNGYRRVGNKNIPDNIKEVVWKKGIRTVNDMVDLCSRIPLPYVAHFRVASCGGVKDGLTHPFPLGIDAPLELEGRTRGGVLFHNGHWNPWNDKVLDAAIGSNNPIPEGDWSDTRGLAWLTHLYGKKVMEMIPDQKGVLWLPDDFEVYAGKGWTKINDVWCSNDYFWTKTRGWSHTPYMGRLCHVGRCTNQAQAGKDVCISCEKKRNEAVDTAAGLDDVEPVTEPVKTNLKALPAVDPVAILTGGDTKRPLMGALTVPEAESAHKAKAMSKSKLKQFKREMPRLAQGGGKAERAKKRLIEISQKAAEKLLGNGLEN